MVLHEHCTQNAMPLTLDYIVREAMARFLLPTSLLRMPQIAYAAAVTDDQRMARALLAAESSNHLLLSLLVPDTCIGNPGAVVQRLLTVTLTDLLWAITPNTNAIPRFVVEYTRSWVSPARGRQMRNAVLYLVLGLLDDGALDVVVRLTENKTGSMVEVTVESDRPGIMRSEQDTGIFQDILNRVHIEIHWRATDHQSWFLSLAIPKEDE